MKAITVEPLVADSARLEDIAEPSLHQGTVLVEAIAVGVCGTDVEIIHGAFGWAPRGERRLVLGHESLGRVLDPGPTGSLQKGDLVVGIVRRPDPVPCPNCAVGEWDMCRNGQYTERGIKEIHGFMSERWRIEPEYAMKVDRSLGVLGVLIEPTTVVTKAWEQVQAVGQRAFWEPRTVLVTGAGPIGLLAALVARQHGFDVHVLDRVESGPKPELVRSLGAHHVIDYTRDDFTRGETKYDLIFHLAGTHSPAACRRALTPKGTLVLSSGDSRGRWLGPLNRVFQAAMLSPFVSQQLAQLEMKRSQDDLSFLTGLIEAGKLTPVIDRTYPLRETAEAIRYLETGRARGKVVIAI